MEKKSTSLVIKDLLVWVCGKQEGKKQGEE
jgi:hypothetical protein